MSLRAAEPRHAEYSATHSGVRLNLGARVRQRARHPQEMLLQ